MSRAKIKDCRVVVVKAQYFMRADPGGCCLHIVLSDGNIETGHVEWCLKHAEERGHAECVDMARALLACSWTQRNKVYGQCHMPPPSSAFRGGP